MTVNRRRIDHGICQGFITRARSIGPVEARFDFGKRQVRPGPVFSTPDGCEGLFGIVVSFDHYRRQSPTVELELDEQMIANEDNLAATVTRRLSNQFLHTAISRLTPGQQQVLALRFGEGLTARETAEVMDKSIGAIEALQHRALAALRRVLEKEFQYGKT